MRDLLGFTRGSRRRLAGRRDDRHLNAYLTSVCSRTTFSAGWAGIKAIISRRHRERTRDEAPRRGRAMHLRHYSVPHRAIAIPRMIVINIQWRVARAERDTLRHSRSIRTMPKVVVRRDPSRNRSANGRSKRMMVHDLIYIEEFFSVQRLRGSARRERESVETRTRFPGKFDRSMFQ